MFKDAYSKWFKKLNSYETCDCRNGDKCPEGHCYYAVLNVINSKNLYFTCGRPVNIIKTQGQKQLN